MQKVWYPSPNTNPGYACLILKGRSFSSGNKRTYIIHDIHVASRSKFCMLISLTTIHCATPFHHPTPYHEYNYNNFLDITQVVMNNTGEYFLHQLHIQCTCCECKIYLPQTIYALDIAGLRYHPRKNYI